MKPPPFEILKQTFQHLLHKERRIFGQPLNVKSDIKTCTLVCKSWNKVATEIFWEKIVTVTLRENKFGRFLSYLSCNPAFALKVKRIQLYTAYMEPTDVPGFKSIMTCCQHLTYLHVDSHYRSADYLQALNCPEIQLSHLEESHSFYAQYPDFPAIDLKVSVYYKFRKKLKVYLSKATSRTTQLSTYMVD